MASGDGKGGMRHFFPFISVSLRRWLGVSRVSRSKNPQSTQSATNSVKKWSQDQDSPPVLHRQSRRPQPACAPRSSTPPPLTTAFFFPPLRNPARSVRPAAHLPVLHARLQALQLAEGAHQVPPREDQGDLQLPGVRLQLPSPRPARKARGGSREWAESGKVKA